jgi:hypothetical protein
MMWLAIKLKYFILMLKLILDYNIQDCALIKLFFLVFHLNFGNNILADQILFFGNNFSVIDNFLKNIFSFKSRNNIF